MSPTTLSLPKEYFLNKNLVVLSDIHSNYDGLSEVIKYIDEMSNNVDGVIFLGDLLTYGCQTEQVLSSIDSLKKRVKCWFVIGNHDEFYFDLQGDYQKTSYILPHFIDESVNWNLKQLTSPLIDRFPWVDSIECGPVFFAHANPYEPRNWTYLNSKEECLLAANILRENKFKLGVFGHTHRRKLLMFNMRAGKSMEFTSELSIPLSRDGPQESICVVSNPGSVGQPRGEGASFMVLRISDSEIQVKFMDISLSRNDYFLALKSAKLSDTTYGRLLSYFGR